MIHDGSPDLATRKATSTEHLEVVDQTTRTESVAQRLEGLNSRIHANLGRMEAHLERLSPQPSGDANVTVNPAAGGLLGSIDDEVGGLERQCDWLKELVDRLTQI